MEILRGVARIGAPAQGGRLLDGGNEVVHVLHHRPQLFHQRLGGEDQVERGDAPGRLRGREQGAGRLAVHLAEQPVAAHVNEGRVEHLGKVLLGDQQRVRGAAHMQAGPLAVRAHGEDGSRGMHARIALHRVGRDAEALQRGKHEASLLVLADRADGERVHAELGAVHDRAAGGARDGEPDLVDEVGVAAVGDARHRTAEDVDAVEPDDTHVVGCLACGVGRARGLDRVAVRNVHVREAPVGPAVVGHAGRRPCVGSGRPRKRRRLAGTAHPARHAPAGWHRRPRPAADTGRRW